MEENIFKYYGLYGRKKNGSYNDRYSQVNDDPYYYKRETQYIHEHFPETLEHMKIHYGETSNIFYHNIKTFEFVPYKNMNSEDREDREDKEDREDREDCKDTNKNSEDCEDINNIKQLLNKSYLHELLNNEDRMPFEGLHLMREMQFKGYNKELSKEIINSYLDSGKKVLNTLEQTKYIDKDKELIRLKRIYELKKGILRSCDNVQNIEGLEKKNIINNKLKIDILNNILNNILLTNINIKDDELLKNLYDNLSLLEYLLKNEIMDVENKDTKDQIQNQYDKLSLILEKILLLKNSLDIEFNKNIINEIIEIISSFKLLFNIDFKEKILLEDLLNNETDKQLILGSSYITRKYVNKKNILINPWYYSDTNMGIYSWNLSINKSMINCFLSNTLKQLFPIRFMLEYHPSYLNFDNIKTVNNYKEKLIYLGFFIIRYDNTSYNIDNIPNIDNECKSLYYHNKDELPTFNKENKEYQFLVLFVFKDLNVSSISKYKIVNFRSNFVEWGNFAEWKRVLLPEIIQVMCHNLHIDNPETIDNPKTIDNPETNYNPVTNYNPKTNYNPETIDNTEINKKIYFYSLLKKDNNKKKDLNEICNTQFQELNGEKNSKKKEIMKCFEAYFFRETFEKIQELGYQPRSDDTTLHILTTSYKIDEIKEELEKNKNYTITLIENNINIKNNATDEEYILFLCHFKWDDKGTRNLGIQHGDFILDKQTKKFYIDTLCISNKCILDRDYPKYNMHNYDFHYNSDDEKKIFKLPSDDYKRKKLLDYFHRLKKTIYLPKDRHNYINIKDIDIQKVINVLYKYLNKLLELYETNNIQNIQNLKQIIKNIIKTQDEDELITKLNNLEKQIDIDRQNINKGIIPLLILKEHAKYLNIIIKCKKIFETIVEIIVKKSTNNKFSNLNEIDISDLEDQINKDINGGNKKELKELNSFKELKKILIEFDIFNFNFNSIIKNYSKLEDYNKYLNKLIFNNSNINAFFFKFDINTKYYNKIIPYIPGFINTLHYLVLSEILIIAHNIFYVDLILTLYKNINITLILFNFNDDEQIKKLKLNKNNSIKIYIIDKDKDEKYIDIYFYTNINKIIKNKKYSSIIIDCGSNNINYYQEKFISIGILLCKNNIINGGSFIHYCMMPKISNYLNLLYILYSNFSLNYCTVLSDVINLGKENRFVVFSHVNYNPNNKYDKIAKKYLKYNKIDKINKIDISDDFIKLLCIKWEEIKYNNTQLFEYILKNNYQKNIK